MYALECLNVRGRERKTQKVQRSKGEIEKDRQRELKKNKRGRKRNI